MIRAIFEASKSETQFSETQFNKLLNEAREYAQVYTLARQRQRGCDGMGELVTLKEELRDVIDKMIQYGKETKYISEVASYDIDSVADELVKGQDPL